eukprot:scaffold74545_cov37-Tisochrysis_lutea.AAC.1
MGRGEAPDSSPSEPSIERGHAERRLGGSVTRQGEEKEKNEKAQSGKDRVVEQRSRDPSWPNEDARTLLLDCPMTEPRAEGAGTRSRRPLRGRNDRVEPPPTHPSTLRGAHGARPLLLTLRSSSTSDVVRGARARAHVRSSSDATPLLARQTEALRTESKLQWAEPKGAR